VPLSPPPFGSDKIEHVPFFFPPCVFTLFATALGRTWFVSPPPGTFSFPPLTRKAHQYERRVRLPSAFLPFSPHSALKNSGPLGEDFDTFSSLEACSRIGGCRCSFLFLPFYPPFPWEGRTFQSNRETSCPPPPLFWHVLLPYDAGERCLSLSSTRVVRFSSFLSQGSSPRGRLLSFPPSRVFSFLSKTVNVSPSEGRLPPSSLSYPFFLNYPCPLDFFPSFLT